MLLGTPYEPTDLFLSRDDIMSAISSLLVGYIKNEFFLFITQIIRIVFMRVIDFVPSFFGNRSEIIVKGVSNIIRVTNSNIINRRGSRNIR